MKVATLTESLALYSVSWVSSAFSTVPWKPGDIKPCAIASAVLTASNLALAISLPVMLLKTLLIWPTILLTIFCHEALLSISPLIALPTRWPATSLAGLSL